MSRPDSSRLYPLVGILVIVILVLAVIFVPKLFRSKNSPTTTPTTSATDQEVKDLVAKVARHMAVKQEEVPAVAIVQDAESLRSQNPLFYKEAQNGDRLLVWSDKAVLYSPSRDLVLAAVPINLQQTIQPTPENLKAEAAKIEVRNGSGTAGLAKTMSAKLQAAGLTVLTPATDAKGKYATTMVIKANDDTRPLPATLQALLTLTGGKLETAPAVEGPLKGDFLVIIGADFKP